DRGLHRHQPRRPRGVPRPHRRVRPRPLDDREQGPLGPFSRGGVTLGEDASRLRAGQSPPLFASLATTAPTVPNPAPPSTPSPSSACNTSTPHQTRPDHNTATRPGNPTLTPALTR